MLFNSAAFFFFFLPLLLAVYASARSTAAKNSVLLAASLAFYFWGETTRIWVLLAIIAASYYGSVLIERAQGREKKIRLLALFIVLDLGALAYFKYAGFFASIIHVRADSWLAASLPLGISFFTFQGISYLVDVYRGNCKRAASLKEFALYITMFPHLIAGPIVRFRQIRSRITRRRFRLKDVNRGLRIFTAGLASKVLIANPLGALSDKIFSTPSHHLDVGQTWLGGLYFSFQIYFDFQGYSLMAIGLAAMLGFIFPHNFNNPYQSQGIGDFWRRWHISLSTWLRDYIYRPLLTRLNMTAAILVTFLVSGLWHGANWNFLIWGLYHGGFRALETNKRYKALVYYPFFGKAVTFIIVLVGWVIFRMEDLPQLLRYLMMMFTGYSRKEQQPLMMQYEELLPPDIILTLAAAMCLTFWAGATRYAGHLIFSRDQKYAWQQNITVAILLILSLAYMSAQTFNPFIYFRF